MPRCVAVSHEAAVSLIVVFPAIDQTCPWLEREVKVGVIAFLWWCSFY